MCDTDSYTGLYARCNISVQHSLAVSQEFTYIFFLKRQLISKCIYYKNGEFSFLGDRQSVVPVIA